MRDREPALAELVGVHGVVAFLLFLAAGALPVDRHAMWIAARSWIPGVHGRVGPYVALTGLAIKTGTLGCYFTSDLAFRGP